MVHIARSEPAACGPAPWPWARTTRFKDLPAFAQANRLNAWGTYLHMEQEALGVGKR